MTKEEPMQSVKRWGFADPHTGDEVEVYADTPEEAEEKFYQLYPYTCWGWGADA